MDLDAHHYQKHSEQQYNRARSLFKPSDFYEYAHVLDVGCGDGKITAEIASLVPKGKVLGIDASLNMIHLANETFRLVNLEFQCIKAEEITISHSFDNIFCFNCLLWVRKPKQALDILCKLLRPGGKLTILTYLKESSYVDFLEQTLTQFPLYKEFSAAHTMLTLDEHQHILELNNLQIQKFSVEESYSYYINEKELKNYLQGWIRSYVPMPEEQQNIFLNQAVRNCFDSIIYQQKEGGIRLPYKSLIIKASKNR
jgi:2-polyprenyl-3-methyl-5-hydroxy-6-metoxy-1,4-benzoquinol methylase